MYTYKSFINDHIVLLIQIPPLKIKQAFKYVFNVKEHACIKVDINLMVKM